MQALRLHARLELHRRQTGGHSTSSPSASSSHKVTSTASQGARQVPQKVGARLKGFSDTSGSTVGGQGELAHAGKGYWRPGPRTSTTAGPELGKLTKGTPDSLIHAMQAFSLSTARYTQARDLIAAYPAFHPSQYAPITSNSRAIPARDRILHCRPPPGCPHRSYSLLHTLSPALRVRLAVVRSAAGGANGFKQVGYALKCFMLWACMHDVPDNALMPLQPEVLEAYVASLAGHVSRKVIVTRITGLRRWHEYYGVDWIIKEAHYSHVLDGATHLAPCPKLKRPPFLMDHLLAIEPFLDFSNSFDVAWWAATTFAHRACLRSGEFTVPSQGAFSTDVHLSLSGISLVYVDGVAKGIKARLPWDKVAGRLGADVSVTALARGHAACPVTALAQHLAVNKVVEGEHLFSYVSSRGTSTGSRMAISKERWRARLDELVAAAGLPPMAGHSVRIGGATQLLLDGVDPLIVKMIGRWKSDAFEVYWRNVTAIIARYTDNRPSAHAPTAARPAELVEELRALAGMDS